MARLCEYRDLSDSDPRPVREVVASARSNFTVPRPPMVELAMVSEGWACAGSMARWDDAHWSVLWEVDGASHGQRYKLEDSEEAGPSSGGSVVPMAGRSALKPRLRVKRVKRAERSEPMPAWIHGSGWRAKLKVAA